MNEKQSPAHKDEHASLFTSSLQFAHRTKRMKKPPRAVDC